MQKRKTSDYTEEVARRTGLDKKTVRKILSHGMLSLCRVMFRGADIRMTGAGHIYTSKPKPKSNHEQADKRHSKGGS